MKRIAQNKYLIIVILAVCMMLVSAVLSSYTCATIVDPNDYKPNAIEQDDSTVVQEKTNPIIGALKTVGIVVAVITIAVLGIKYMAAGINERAEYKKTMIPYLVGAVLVVAITQLLSVLIEIVTGIK